MAHFKITSVTWESMKEEFGVDSVFFNVIVVSDDDPEVCFPLLLSYRDVIRHASQEFPMIPTILEDARNHISGWGPQESVLIGELEECGFNVMQLAQKAFESLYDIEKEAARNAMIKSNPAQIVEIVHELHELVPRIKEETVNYYQLCELLERSISDAVISQFPVLINSSPGCISELKTVLVNHIPRLADDLVELIEKAKTD